jgi:hypothetical protein
MKMEKVDCFCYGIGLGMILMLVLGILDGIKNNINLERRAIAVNKAAYDVKTGQFTWTDKDYPYVIYGKERK